jgi:molybdopterin-binding protein
LQVVITILEVSMKISARNQLIAKVSQIKKGTVMCQVNLDLVGKGKMASVITLDSAKELGLKKGDRVRVIVKAVNVLVGK